MKKLLIMLALFLSFESQAQKYNLLVGTYTNKGNSEGIYVYDYNTITGEAKLKSSAASINPSFLAVSKDGKFVYAVNEDAKNSTVSAFSFNAQLGNLSLLNKKPSGGADPCFVVVEGDQVILANYSGGSISVFGRTTNGSLTAIKQNIEHTGKSVDPKRQLSSHVHQAQLTPDKKFVVVNDLGEDQVYVYEIGKIPGKKLTLKSVIKTKPGSGPRHLAFSPNGKFAYLAHEFNGSITAFAYQNGTLTKLQEVESVAKDYNGKIDAADIHVSADGKFLYETNRGDLNTISLYSIAAKGKLTLVETVSTLGKGPRNFTIDPSGKHLLVAHQYTNDVVIFNRDNKTGKLKDSGKRINVGVPVCLVFAK